VNPPSLLQIVERLEGLAGKLPSRIRKAVLSELTPLKQLFLQQRPPRFLFTGSSRIPLTRIIHGLFAPGDSTQTRDLPLRVSRWHNVSLSERGTISILDAREADDSASNQVRDELKFQSADVIFFLEEEQTTRELESRKVDHLITYLVWNNASVGDAKIIGIITPPTGQPIVSDATDITATRLKSALRSSPMLREHVLEVLSLSLARGAEPVEVLSREAQKLMSILARELPKPGPNGNDSDIARRRRPARSRSGPDKIYNRYLRSNRRPADPARRSTDSHDLTANDGRRNYVCERP